MVLVTILSILALQAEPAAPAAEPPAAPAAPAADTAQPRPPQPETPQQEAPPQATPPADPVLPDEKPTRAYIVVDRVTVASGTIESDDETVIVLRDEKGRVKSFSKNRVFDITYLLDGPVGRRVRVAFNDGRVIVGALVEDGYEHVELEVAGIKTKYDREAVTAVYPYPTDRELYERFRKSLEPDQYGARYTLALWLYNKKMYPEARTELESLLEATNHYEAKRLLTEVSAQIALMEGAAPPSGAGKGSSEGLSEVRGASGVLGSALLSDAEVNLIRVYELDTANPPLIQVSPALIDTMLEKYADSELIPAKSAERSAFKTKEPIEIVKTLFALKARELYKDIEVLGDPESVALMRQSVHPWLIGNCATSKCHGGADAGRFFLHNRKVNDPNVVYTNLLILQRTRLDTLPLIDSEKPTDSLIFQYALPKTEARRPHPDVRGWSPVLSNSRKNLQEKFVDWVRAMRMPRGDYPVEYTPPALRSPDRPATTGPDR